MNYSMYIVIFLVLFLLFEERKHREMLFFRILRGRKQGTKRSMNEVINEFVGKECIIYTINSQIIGTLTELKEGWIVVETPGGKEALNLEHIGRIREFPRNKKGRKKAIVAD